MTKTAPEVDLRALDLFERLAARPGNLRFRRRLLKAEPPAVLERVAKLELAHAARAAMATQIPGSTAAALVEPPSQIGPFRLVERIGYGGMGDVWRGERDDGRFEQVVAIKLIHAHLSGSAAQAFEVERRILAKLDHPDIVRLTDGGETESGLPYLIMDYVEGVPLDEAVASLPLRQRVAVLRQAAAVVQFAHSRLVAHADLKPSNILVDSEGRVRLLDFGIAGLLTEEGEPSPSVGAMTGGFASPQRLAGAPPSIADDVYALGMILSLIIADAGDLDLIAIAAKAMAREEVNRYGTVADLDLDLEHWQGGFPVSARPVGIRDRARKFAGRHRLGVLASTFGLLALVSATLFATVSSIRAESARAEAAARFEDARGTARYLLFTLMDRLEAQPNSLALRTEVADVAQHYLDRLSRADGAAPEVRVEAARGLIRLAEAQGVPGYPNLSQTDLAQRNLIKALEILAGVSSKEARAQSVKALAYQARLSSLVDQRADQALKLLAKADAIFAAEPGLPLSIRGMILNERAVALSEKNQYTQAIPVAQSALNLLPPRGTLDEVTERAKAADLLAESVYYGQSAQAAVQPYEDAVGLLEAAHQRFPESRIIMQRLARQRWALASTILSLDRNAEALTLLTATAKDLRQMVAFDTDDEEAARLLQMVELDRAEALADVGRVDEGLVLLRANIDSRQAWFARAPTELRRFRDLVVAVKLLGDVQVRHNRVRAGCLEYLEFHKLVSQMAARGNLAEMDMAYTLKGIAETEARFCGKVAVR